MVDFSVPLKDKRFYDFKVKRGALLFAGSRHLEIDPEICRLLIDRFVKLDFSFITGCATGADLSFKRVLSKSLYKDRTFIACAFKERLRFNFGLKSSLVVGDSLPPRVALARRTLWMTKRASMAVIFPSSPIGRGSLLALKSMVKDNKPVFLASSSWQGHIRDLLNGDLKGVRVIPNILFGVVKGVWVVPEKVNGAVVNTVPFKEKEEITA